MRTRGAPPGEEPDRDDGPPGGPVVPTAYAWLFPGQGSQSVGMGRSLYEDSPAARRVLELADETLGIPLTRLLFEGRRVIVDASFREENRRREFLETALAWGVPGLFLLCTADAATVRERLRSRKGDASDADWAVYLKAAETWEDPGPRTRSALQFVSTGGSVEQALSQAVDVLRLWDFSG